MDRDTPRPSATAEPVPDPSAGTTTGRLRTPYPQDEAPADALKDAVAALGEAREYVSYYATAKLDSLKLTVRRAVILAAVGVVGLLAGGAVVITAAALLCIGLAQALGAAFGGRVWLGNLIVGIALLLLIGGGAWFLMWRLFGSSKRATVKKYELLRQRQRADRGHDVLQRAQERQSG